MDLTPNQLKLIAKHPRMAGIIAGTEKGPGLVQQAVNYVVAVVRYHRNDGWMLPLELVEQRTTVCRANGCAKYDATKDKCLHRKCGCTVSEKAKWSTESCPEKLWLPMFGPAPAPDVAPK